MGENTNFIGSFDATGGSGGSCSNTPPNAMTPWGGWSERRTHFARMVMNRLFTLLLAASCFTALGQESYEIIGSSDSTFFLLSDHYLSWNEAKDVAQTYDGHLATFTDLEENSVILAEVPTAPEGGYWFGLYQVGEGEEPGQGWGWVTTMPFNSRVGLRMSRIMLETKIAERSMVRARGMTMLVRLSAVYH